MTDRIRLWMAVTAFLWGAALVLQARLSDFPAWPGFLLFILLVFEWAAVLVLKYKGRQE
ncbi:hypothetical protein [Marinococcus sp. PL1-022]|uniref:hypothetical protein n=1 Tax=Marinococcus sp. PL1-022 TaxID=3095363 RepID=UPI0029C12950|nr:hypothetical protein [Marinococcus sp. PL1-022]MDX6152155.1 hypothetical protein [Marinococcus sp. PL1-022]